MILRLILLLLLAVVGCGDGIPAHGRRPMVLVSVPPQAWLVEQIAGDLVDVTVLVPPGASPATHAPTMRDLKAVSRAVLYLKVGHPDFPFERAWIDRILSGTEGLTVVDGATGVEILDDDPHVWVSPASMEKMGHALAAGLKQVLPDRGAEIDAGLAKLRGVVAEVSREITPLLQPYAGRKFFVFHPAWGYFAREYGLVQVAVERHGKEVDPHDLAELIEEVRESGLKVIFVQPQFSKRSAQLIAEEIGGTVRVADPLARDWAANLREVAANFAEAFSE